MAGFLGGMNFLSLNAEEETDFKGIQIANLTIHEDNLSLMDIDEEDFLATSESPRMQDGDRGVFSVVPLAKQAQNSSHSQDNQTKWLLTDGNVTKNYNDYEDEDYIMEVDYENSFNAGEQRIEDAEMDNEGNIVVVPKTLQTNIFSKDKNTSPIGDILSGISRTSHAILSPTLFGADLAKKSLFRKINGFNTSENAGNGIMENNTSVHTGSYYLSDNDSLHPFFTPTDDTYTETPIKRNTEVRKNLFERRFREFKKLSGSENQNGSSNIAGVSDTNINTKPANRQDTVPSSNLRHSIGAINDDLIDDLDIVDDLNHENYASPLKNKSPNLESVIPQFSPILCHNTSSTPNVKSSLSEISDPRDFKKTINDDIDEIDEINLDEFKINNALTPTKPINYGRFETPMDQSAHDHHNNNHFQFHNHIHYHAAGAPVQPDFLDNQRNQDAVINRTNTSPDNLPSPWSKRTEYAKSPTAYMISTYIQLMFNILILLSCGYIVFSMFQVICADISKKFQEKAEDILMEASICYKNYHNNRCDSMPPALERQCHEWGRCMNRQPNLSTYRAMIAAEIFGTLINSFVEPIGTKAFTFFLILVLFWVFGSNFAFGFIRGKSFYGNNAKELITERSDDQCVYRNNNELQLVDMKKNA